MISISAKDLIARRVPDLSELRGTQLESVDLSTLSAKSLRILSCRFVRCSFDQATLDDLRIWDSHFDECSFRDATMRGFSFGGALDGRFNSFRRCDFERADLRNAGGGPAEMTGCRFVRTNLRKIEFSGTRLTDTVFAGRLNEVIFHAHSFTFPKEPPNEMLRVDFSDAELRWCDFRGLDLDTVIPPSADTHILVADLPWFLQIAIRRYEPTAPSAAGLFRHVEKWRGPRQTRGFFHTDDLAEILPAAEIEFLRSIAGGDPNAT